MNVETMWVQGENTQSTKDINENEITEERQINL